MNKLKIMSNFVAKLQNIDKNNGKRIKRINKES